MDKASAEQLRQFAKSYWDNLDVDAFQPIFHGPRRTEEELKRAEEQMKHIEALTKAYNETLTKSTNTDNKELESKKL